MPLIEKLVQDVKDKKKNKNYNKNIFKIWRTRSLLMMIPLNVAVKLKAFREYLRSLAFAK